MPIPWIASTPRRTARVPVCPVSAIFALDDLPEKWKHFTEINATYVQGGKFTPEEYAKRAAK